MDNIEVCQKVKKAIRHILIQNQTSILSSGTGIVIKSDGTLITAKHVIEEENVGIYHGKITAKGLETERIEYRIVTTGFGFDVDLSDYINPISIDLAVLKPVQQIQNSDFISLCTDLAEVGTDIIIGGFPDDVSLPFDFLDKLNINNPKVALVKEKIDKQSKFYFRQLMFKHAMIGHAQKIKLNNFDASKFGLKNLTKINVTGSTYWIDNHLTYGGSGGPVVNLNGELLGIICQKAFTDSKTDTPKKFPSGTGMALSHHLISWLIDYL
jgi:hypothetical protein